MEVRAAGAAISTTQTPKPSGDKPPQVPANPAEGLKPQEVPLLLSQSSLAQGQSLAEVSLVENIALPSLDVEAEPLYTPRAILPEEIKRVNDAYNRQVRAALEAAPHGSRLEQFETSLRLMANLQEPQLQKDSQAWDTIQMRRSQIETSYQRLIQEPEVKQAFDRARWRALGEIFGEQLPQRAGQQAAYLLDDSFQHELDALPDDQVQPRIEQEISALAVLDPKLAKSTAEELIQRTAVHQSIKALKTGGDQNAAVKAGVSQAIGLYLKAQQTALGLSLQATNMSRLVNLPDEQISQLTDAIADLASSSKASTPQQLALDLVSRVDDLPENLRADASKLISHMHTQNVLGTVLLAGSVAGLLRQDLPKDPKSWASLGAGALGTATMAHFAFRTLGLNQAADFASKINFSVALRGVKIPVVGALVTGVNTTLDAIAFVDEVKNEDTAGAISRAMGVGSGLATLAAITLMKGKAVPLTLIGSTVTGLAAWGVESLWGESDATGRIRRDLRALGISAEEKVALKEFEHGASPDTMSISDRIDTINALMDQNTSAAEETEIFELLMRTPEKDFLPLMQQLHTPRLVAELENRQQLELLLQRVARQTDGKQPPDKLFTPLLQGLVSARRFDEMKAFLAEAPPAFKQTLSPKTLQSMIEDLLQGWTRANEEKAVVRLLTDPDLQSASGAMLKLGGEKMLLRLHSELEPEATGALLGRMLGSSDAELSALAGKVFDRPSGQRLPYLTQLGDDAQAARLATEALNRLSRTEIHALPATLRGRFLRLLESQGQGGWLLSALKN